MLACIAWGAILGSFYAADGLADIDPDLVEIYDLAYTGEVVPTPQQVRYWDEYLLLIDAKGTPVAAVAVAPSAPVPVRIAAAELSAQAGHLLRPPPDQMPFPLPLLSPTDPRLRRARTVIALGIQSDAPLPAEAAGKAGAYVVSCRRADGQWRVTVVGRDAQGAYYGAQSLLQLMSVRDGQVVLRRADIRDWPAYTIRAHQYDGGFPAPSMARYSLKWAAKFKLNQLGFGQAYDRPMQWRQLTRKQQQSTQYLCARATAIGVIRAAFYPHPHRSRDEFNIRISKQEDMDALVNICSFALERGARAIMLRSDDIWPLAPEDKQRFGDQATAHTYMVNELFRRLKQRWPDVVFMFCPPHYTNGTIRSRKGGEDYIRKLGKETPHDVLVVWTGPVTRSLDIQPQDVDYIIGLLGRGPLLWDNTVYAHRSRYGYDPRHPNYFLDTFATRYPADFPERVPGISYNWSIRDPISLVAGINTADYMWNPKAYDPERSLRRALAMVAGPDCVDDLLAIRELYYQIFDAVTGGLLAQEAHSVAEAASKLSGLVESVGQRSSNEDFVKALSGRVARVQRMAGAARPVIEALSAARKTTLVDLDFSHGGWQQTTQGDWKVTVLGRSARIEFPWGTPSAAGAHGTIARTVTVPPSPTGRYYLVFSCTDNYTASGTPRRAWPGYLFKQALVGDQVVWEDDVEGDEPVQVEAAHVVDVTDAVQGRKQVTIAFRGLDKRGVGNMGAKILFGSPALVAGPFTLASLRGEVPGWSGLNLTTLFTVLVTFTIDTIGPRQALFDKAPPHQYFAYVHEDGHVVGGVFIDGKEHSLAGRTKLQPGDHAVALIYYGDRLVLMLDGDFDATADLSGEVDTGAGNLHLGQYARGAMPLHGRIATVGVWARPLGMTELLHAVSGQPPKNGLVGFWDLGGASGWSAPCQLQSGQPCTIYRILTPRGQ